MERDEDKADIMQRSRLLGEKIEQERKKVNERNFYGDIAEQEEAVASEYGKIYKTPLERAIEAKERQGGRASQAIKISSDFFSAIAVGATIGLFLDKFVTPSPLGLVIFLLIGFAAGFLNVMRYAAGKAKNNKPNSLKGDIE